MERLTDSRTGRPESEGNRPEKYESKYEERNNDRYEDRHERRRHSDRDDRPYQDDRSYRNDRSDYDDRYDRNGRNGGSGWMIIPLVILVVLAVLSNRILSPAAVNPDNHAKEITYLDEKKATVTALSASAAGVAVLISVIPDDIASPIANKLADISADFLVVMAAMTAEKYLLSVTGYIAFFWLVPITCLLFGINMLLRSRFIHQLAWRLLLFGLAIYMVVPVSISLSEIIERTYKESIEESIEAAREIEEEWNMETQGLSSGSVSSQAESGNADSGQETIGMPAEGTETKDRTGLSEGEKGENRGFFGEFVHMVAQLFGGVADSATRLADGTTSALSAIPELPQKAGELMNRYMETLVIMVVTTCVIPILTILSFVWIINLILGIRMESLPRLRKLF